MATCGFALATPVACEIFHEKGIDVVPDTSTMPALRRDNPMASTPQEFRSIGLIYTLVSEFVAPIVLGLIVDWQAGTSPWGLLVGVIFGLTLGGMGVKRLIRQLDEAEKRKKEQP